jgi:hypothetical protein
VGTQTEIIRGNPDPEFINTSFAEKAKFNNSDGYAPLCPFFAFTRR